MRVHEFIIWVAEAGAEGRTMQEYIDCLGSQKIRPLLDATVELGLPVDAVPTQDLAGRRSYRFVLRKEDENVEG